MLEHFALGKFFIITFSNYYVLAMFCNSAINTNEFNNLQFKYLLNLERIPTETLASTTTVMTYFENYEFILLTLGELMLNLQIKIIHCSRWFKCTLFK